MVEKEKRGKKKDTEAQVDVGNKSPTTGTKESCCCCYLFKGKSALFRNRRGGWGWVGGTAPKAGIKCERGRVTREGEWMGGRGGLVEGETRTASGNTTEAGEGK